MEALKSYTDIDQSKKLAEILPIESADMCYNDGELRIGYAPLAKERDDYFPCWSLAALLSVLPKYIGDYGKCLYFNMGYYYCGYMVDGDFMLSIEETSADNPIDACVEMILKLHELNLL